MAEKKETQVETVTMSDGRLVEFAGKKKLQKESFVTPEGKVQVRLDFRNAETRLFTIPDTLMNKFASHGAEQKLGDEIAGLKGSNGGEADIEDCVLAIDELIDRLYNNEWSQKREANGLAGTSVLLRALVEHTGKTAEQIKTFLSGKTQAEKTALRNNPKIKPIIEKIEAEKAAKGTAKVDTESLLGELEAVA